MRYLLDTHLLLWSLYAPIRLPGTFTRRLQDSAVEAFFSVVSLTEVAIKLNLGKLEFEVELNAMRNDLLDNSFVEIPLLSQHAVALRDLPLLHRDPFDRLLVAQAKAENLVLLTVDKRLAE